ncbi:MAG: carbon monoxide dehydrogenase subunit [Acidimicrobiaceae bacterium]|nr:carbon monoxide dehydrogenase subunit [Acidimicrobiaceae bacterium]
MELSNEFEVAVPIERAWAVLTDLELIAPCLPGAQLREVEGEEYRGAVKIKVGPITTSYKGTIRITELDEIAHRAVMKAEGRESRGQGDVTATITANMSSSEAGTKVVITTDLTISGKVAQFGRGVLADVSAKMLDQFVANLESKVLVEKSESASQDGASANDSGNDAAASRVDDESVPRVSRNESSHPAPESSVGARRINSEEAEPVNLVDIAGGSLARRVAMPSVVIGVALVALLRFARRRRR